MDTETLADEIRASQEEVLDYVALRDEFIRLFEENDTSGLVDIMHAYMGWKTRTSDDQELDSNTIKEIEDNLYIIAMLADHKTDITEEPGPVAKFYIESTGYIPLEG
ncbi:MAG: hypothetical protein GY861_08730 [bacterium]|nr:hypothetical protein [bacterium]